MKRLARSNVLTLGSRMPQFSLKSVDGSVVDSSKIDAQATLILFMCNHCPYVVGSIRMVNQVINEFMPKGLFAVGINSNDPEKYPQDSFENMKIFARENELCFPYCFDETQEVAKLFDAQCTPEAYLFDSDKRLFYHGGVVENPLDPSNNGRVYLRDVLNAWFTNGSLENLNWSDWLPEGCSIKWR